MQNNFNTPKQIAQNFNQSGIDKTKLTTPKLFILGILAGMFIAFGACCSMLATHNIADPGMAKFVAGLVFPVGLMLIVLVGGELFTGDCLMIIPVLDKKVKVSVMLRKLFIVFISNFVGAMIVVLLVKFSAQQDMSMGGLGAVTIKTALAKVSFNFGTAFVSGIACNIIVCAAVIMAGAATDVVGKIAAVFFTILVFVISGFEHCVANMYYIPAGILAKMNDTYAQKAIDMFGITAEQLESLNFSNFVLKNLVPVTLGNMVGGMLFIGAALYILHIKQDINKDDLIEIKQTKIEEEKVKSVANAE